MSCDRLSISISSFVFHANERKNTGFKFTANRVFSVVCRPQIHQHFSSILCLAAFQHAQSKLPQIFSLSFWINFNQLLNHLLVVPVIVADLIDATLLLQLFNHVLAGLRHVLFRNFRSRHGVIDTRIDSHQQTGFPRVRGTIGEFFLNLDGNVSQCSQSACDSHQSIFHISPAGNGGDFSPQGEPLIQCLILVTYFAV